MAPQVFYKFLTPEHANGLVQRGSVRFGTYMDFRRTETYGEEIGDAEEGVARYTMNVPDTQRFNGHNAPGIIRHFFDPGPSCEVILENCYVKYQNTTDAWLYCVSDTWSEEMQRRSRYTACVEIFDRDLFFLALADFMHPNARFFGVHQCRYVGRDLAHDSTLGSAIVKPEGYAYQREWRAIWEPYVPPPEPFNAAIPSLVDRCRRIV